MHIELQHPALRVRFLGFDGERDHFSARGFLTHKVDVGATLFHAPLK